MPIDVDVRIARWRPRPELNRGKRFCRPLRNHSATWPGIPAELSLRPEGAFHIQERMRSGNAGNLAFSRSLPQNGAAFSGKLRRQGRCMVDYALARQAMVDRQ